MNQLGKFDNDDATPPLAVNQVLIGTISNATAMAINKLSTMMVIAGDRLELWNGHPTSGYELRSHIPGTATYVDVYSITIAVASSTSVNVYNTYWEPRHSYTFTAVTGLGIQANRILVSELGTVWNLVAGRVTTAVTGGATFGTSISVGETLYAVSEPALDKVYVYNIDNEVTNTFSGDTGFGTYLSMSQKDDYVVASGTDVFVDGDVSSIKARICDVSSNTSVEISAPVTDSSGSHRTEAVYASSTYINIYAAERFFKFSLKGKQLAVHSIPGLLAAAATDRILVSANSSVYMWIHEPLSFGERVITSGGTHALQEGQHQVRIATNSGVTITLPLTAVDGDIVYMWRTNVTGSPAIMVRYETASNNYVTIVNTLGGAAYQFIYLAVTNKWYLAGNT